MGEVDYVGSCPVCDVRFIGMSPDEFREEHAPDCDPLAELYHFDGRQLHTGSDRSCE